MVGVGEVGAVLPGWLWTAGLRVGVVGASFPTGVPTLAPCDGALLASSAVSLLMVWLRPAPTVGAA